MSCDMFGENKCCDEKGNAGCGYHSEPMAPACLASLTSLLAASNAPPLFNRLNVLSFVCFFVRWFMDEILTGFRKMYVKLTKKRGSNRARQKNSNSVYRKSSSKRLIWEKNCGDVIFMSVHVLSFECCCFLKYQTYQNSYFFSFLQEAFVRLMGRENFERYGGPIWQLKFCESFKVN